MTVWQIVRMDRDQILAKLREANLWKSRRQASICRCAPEAIRTACLVIPADSRSICPRTAQHCPNHAHVAIDPRTQADWVPYSPTIARYRPAPFAGID